MNNSIILGNENIIRKSSFISCLAFLVAHIMYLVFFLIVNVDIMIYTNIGSILVYTFLLYLIKKGHYATYAIIAGAEIAFYMTFAGIVLGKGPGFHLCLIAVTILVFFAGYFSKTSRNIIKPLWFSIGYIALYTFLYFWFKYQNPLRVISDLEETILYVAHIVIVFGFDIVFLSILTTYAVNLEKRIMSVSETDKLTNVPNRNGLTKYYDALTDQKCNYILAIFDIDNFKKFNDKNGHLCGDLVLKEIARIAKENSTDDFVSRWGGEEFVIISKIDETVEDTISKIDRIRTTVEGYSFVYGNKKLKSTITIGVATYEEGLSLNDWIKKADSKLYAGKQSGKNKLMY